MCSTLVPLYGGIKRRPGSQFVETAGAATAAPAAAAAPCFPLYGPDSLDSEEQEIQQPASAANVVTTALAAPAAAPGFPSYGPDSVDLIQQAAPAPSGVTTALAAGSKCFVPLPSCLSMACPQRLPSITTHPLPRHTLHGICTDRRPMTIRTCGLNWTPHCPMHAPTAQPPVPSGNPNALSPLLHIIASAHFSQSPQVNQECQLVCLHSQFIIWH